MRQISQKFYVLFLALFLGVSLAACGGGGNPAENAALGFYNAAYKGETDKMLSLAADVDMSKESEKSMAKGKLEMMSGAAKEEAGKKGGFKKVEVSPEKPSEIAEDKATVYVVTHFGDGTKKEERTRLVKENGAWKVKLGG